MYAGMNELRADEIQVLALTLVFIITEFTIQVQGNEHTTGQADRETENVDERKSLVPHDASPGGL
jgi:hypothetical protein